MDIRMIGRSAIMKCSIFFFNLKKVENPLSWLLGIHNALLTAAVAWLDGAYFFPTGTLSHWQSLSFSSMNTTILSSAPLQAPLESTHEGARELLCVPGSFHLTWCPHWEGGVNACYCKGQDSTLHCDRAPLNCTHVLYFLFLFTWQYWGWCGVLVTGELQQVFNMFTIWFSCCPPLPLLLNPFLHLTRSPSTFLYSLLQVSSPLVIPFLLLCATNSMPIGHAYGSSVVLGKGD